MLFRSGETVIETRVNAPPSSMVVLADLYPVNVASGPSGPAVATQSTLNEPVGSLKTFLRDQEAAYLNKALAQSGGDKEKAAELLGISLATLYRKLAEVEEAA